MKDINAGSIREEENVSDEVTTAVTGDVTRTITFNKLILFYFVKVSIADRSKEELDGLIVKVKSALQGTNTPDNIDFPRQ